MTRKKYPFISYGGEAVLLEDSDGRLQDFLAEYFEFNCTNSSPTQRNQSGKSHSRTGWRSVPGLSRPNWPPRPAPKLNSLYWPTGASRWGEMFLAVDGKTKEKIVQKAYLTRQIDAGTDVIFSQGKDEQVSVMSTFTNSVALNLILDDGSTGEGVEVDEDGQALFSGETVENKALSISMYLLPPQPIQIIPGEKSGTQLWLLHLVDFRYWWQTVPPALNANSSDWFSIDALIPAMPFASTGTTTSDSLPFTVPNVTNSHKLECHREGEGAAELIDAMVMSSGRMFTLRFDGSIHLGGYDAAGDTLLASNLETYERISGSIVPNVPIEETFRVVFPMQRDQIMLTDYDFEDGAAFIQPIATRFIEDIDMAATAFEVQRVTIPNAVKTIHTTMAANITYTDADNRDNPTNQTKITSLAAGLAVAYAKSKRQYDFAFAGIKPWKPTAWCDHIMIDMYTLKEAKVNRTGDDPTTSVFCFKTRVRSFPYNFGLEDMLHEDSTADTITLGPGGMLGFTASDITAFDGALRLGVGSATLYRTKNFAAANAIDIEEYGGGLVINVFNMTQTVIPGGTWIQIKIIDGKPFVDVVECGA